MKPETLDALSNYVAQVFLTVRAVRNYGEEADIFKLDDATDKLLKAIEQEAIEQPIPPTTEKH